MVKRVSASFVLVLVATCWPLPAAAQQTGRVTGVVLDAYNAQPLPGVTVEADGGSAVAHTELDGRYTLDLPVGSHELTINMDGYQTKSIQVTVESGRAARADVTLSLGGFTEAITVTGQAIEAQTSTAVAQLAERQRSPVITDNVGSSEMKQNADTDAAASMQRVTGLSVVDNQFVYVRGLGERYSNTTLNGATLPSTDFERRVVSLDIFPSSLLESVSIVKSYTPDRPAEFAGGLVEIVPSKLPGSQILDFSYSFGANTNTFGSDVIDHNGGDGDWLGLPNGSRDLPGAFPDRRVIRGGIFTPDLGVSRDELERLGELLPNEWEPVAADGKPNNSWSIAYGNRWGDFGLLASVNQSYKSQFQEEVQNYYRVEGGQLTPFSEYDYVSTTNRGQLAGIASLAYQVNSTNRLAYQLFSTNKGKRETRTFEGPNADVGRNIRNARLLWLEERLLTNHVSGDHALGSGGRSRVDWRFSASYANRDEPDIRETLYEEFEVFQLADESQSGFRQFNDLDEDSYDFSINYSGFFTGINGLPAMVKAGPYYSHRKRDFASRRFRFIPLPNAPVDLTLDPEQLFTPANIGPQFELREETRSTDFYEGEQTITAAYGMVDVPLSAKWRVIGGLRVEQFDQTVDTFDFFDVNVDDNPETISNEIDETDVFPSANLVYAIRPDQNLRFSVSQTVNRPEFREVSPFEFTDIVGGRAVVGNPDLRRALIRNYDVRWEWFPGAEEVIAASIFYKDFDNPIERFVEPTAQLRTSYTNAQSARNVGVELEARSLISESLLVGANYTFVDSEIELQPFQTNVLTSLSRPLSGTSKNIFNGSIEYRYEQGSARLLVNYFDERIIDVGSLGLPDIFESGRATLDFVYSHRFGRLNIRFSADNLTDETIEFTQGDQLQRAYDLGRTIAVNFGVVVF